MCCRLLSYTTFQTSEISPTSLCYYSYKSNGAGSNEYFSKTVKFQIFVVVDNIGSEKEEKNLKPVGNKRLKHSRQDKSDRERH